MNLPNKLTLFRVILIPVFMILFLNCGTAGLYLSLFVFLLAAFTDFLDGRIARRTGSVTTFGKLMDPMADKLLTFAALICFLAADAEYINAWVLIVIIGRELIVTGMRMLALEENIVISASFLGKLKTVSQFLMITAVIINEIIAVYSEPMHGGFWNFVVFALVIAAVVLTLVSGVDYIYKNRGLFTFK
ncbi:MAG TPA: CDP-diacylglycerol--glycerol-3-phosphate 3-phosphatidyltransferase [Candidatus Monoglobus merdigallinarum]|uniref:CDP-diacylglycerol--glycerol-3-phosphate 3-phosphatidyltransferase n=1 Tax=Candidatus Monoglobus merdigallinarum TaxID=2838698 RepID=A0A9D1PQW5_9FIRM|nr:CDP-diacylglycerol--glycerol-3-phosphate 3-phosphatidyltransferase [Candidatus Monoglobus merdigallinarum]